jgi:pimeloyl-ACP methyl ester carboxylesterase
MATAKANGIEVTYEVAGDPADEAVLLIMGLGGQLTMWEEPFVDELVRRGRYVIRFDNRDVGRSTWFDEAGVPDLATGFTTGEFPTPPYTLEDMADDAAGLLDELGVERAHVVGASMGGMIAQTFALRYPERTTSLTSIMSTTGAPGVGAPQPEVAQALFFSGTPTARDEVIRAGIAAHRLIDSPGYPFDEARVGGLVAASYDRAFHPPGVARQLLAVATQDDRTAPLSGLRVPTLVIHGEDDALVDVSGGRATAAAVPGATLWLVPGMGHDLPPALFAEVAERIVAIGAAAR